MKFMFTSVTLKRNLSLLTRWNDCPGNEKKEVYVEKVRTKMSFKAHTSSKYRITACKFIIVNGCFNCRYLLPEFQSLKKEVETRLL